MYSREIELILNALDEGIHIVDSRGTTIFYNKKVSEIEGLDPEEVLGKNIFAAYPSLTPATSNLIATLRTGRATGEIQQTFINSRGNRITTVNKTVPITLDDGTAGAMEISRDITTLETMADDISKLRTSLENRDRNPVGKNICTNNTSYTFSDIVGGSPVLNSVLQDAMRAAGSDSTILLYGETGTGKEMVAQGIHNASSRKKRPFIAQNCAALPKELLEGLLFGTEKGSFTGAVSRPGLFEQADGGTILLDEINAMDLSLQAKLLRVLQESRLRRIGGTGEISVDVRVIATMNSHPEQALRQGSLRADLFYRLSVVYLEIPPLRARGEDIPLLTNHFIKFFNRRFSRSIQGVTGELELLCSRYSWPGNVRELKHALESAFNILPVEARWIGCEHLPGYLKERIKGAARPAQIKQSDLKAAGPSLPCALRQIETDQIRRAMVANQGNISAAARDLGISRQLLQYKIKKYAVTW